MEMRKILVIAAITVSVALVASPASAASKKSEGRVCATITEAKAALLTGAGVTTASASTVAASTGLASLTHSSGAVILSSVGAGGTGYIAGTLGGATAAVLGFFSAPAAVITGTVIAVGATGTYAWCKLAR